MRRASIFKSLNDTLFWSALALSALGLSWLVVPKVVDYVHAESADPERVLSFTGIYEPSAVQQLASGQLLVLEDEVSRALNLLDVSGVVLTENAIVDQQLSAQLKEDFDDLEGITMGRDRVVYATTSYSRTGKGKRRPNREKLLRLTLSNDGKINSTEVYPELISDLEKSSIFQRLSQQSNDKAVKLKDINIEGLSFDRDQQRLLFGLKKPLLNELSIIIAIENPDQVFNGTAVPSLGSEPFLLDLSGGGIRSLHYDDRLKAYLIANEVDFGGGPKQSQIWYWKGGRNDQPLALALPHIAAMENIEAITSVATEGVSRILLLSDDGSRRQKRPAQYTFVDYEEIESQLKLE